MHKYPELFVVGKYVMTAVCNFVKKYKTID